MFVEKAIHAGIRNVDRLTDIVFYLHHPERQGRALGPHEGALINQWKSFRSMVQPRARLPLEAIQTLPVSTARNLSSGKRSSIRTSQGEAQISSFDLEAAPFVLRAEG
jgi:hypothetical protein